MTENDMNTMLDALTPGVCKMLEQARAEVRVQMAFHAYVGEELERMALAEDQDALRLWTLITRQD